MNWVSVFTAFLVAHMVGDYLFQTDWQARHKRGGLSGGVALFSVTRSLKQTPCQNLNGTSLKP